MSDVPLQITVNGQPRSLAVDPRMPLLWVLRDELGLTGSKPGCLQGLCGACTVWLDGAPARACQTPVGEVAGRVVTTIEGLPPDLLLRLTRAWARHHALQCGYCQPGQAMTAAALLAEVQAGAAQPGAEAVRDALAGHLCRCGTQHRVVQAVVDALHDGPQRGRP